MAPILGLGVGRGMAEAVEPLSHSERLEVQGLIAARARIAWAFSAVAVAATAMLLLRFAVRGLGGDVGLMAMTVALAGVSGAVAWRLGWRLVLALRRDEDGGRKRVVRGTITQVDRSQDASGVLVTRATVDGLDVIGRGQAMAAVDAGDVVVVDVLPCSGLVLGVRRAAG